MPIASNQPDPSKFNPNANLPFQLRLKDFELAMQDVYDFFYDVNLLLISKGLQRLDDTLRPANMSGLLSDMLTASLGKHSRTLVQNRYFNGHPDLVVQGHYPNESVKAGQKAWKSRPPERPEVQLTPTAHVTNGCVYSSMTLTV